MTIICTQAEKQWLEKLMAESDNCGLNCHCMCHCMLPNGDDCRQRIERNVKFIYNKEKINE